MTSRTVLPDVPKARLRFLVSIYSSYVVYRRLCSGVQTHDSRTCTVCIISRLDQSDGLVFYWINFLYFLLLLVQLFSKRHAMEYARL